MNLWDQIDLLPDVQFMAVFIVLLIVALLLEWAFERWTGSKK
jgi:hypothetical protein